MKDSSHTLRYGKWRAASHASAYVLLGIPLGVQAIGSRIPNQDPAAIARGNAFAATADNPAALYYNPAGITQLEGHNVHIGSLFYLNVYGDYQSPSGERTESINEILPVPSLHYAFSPKNSAFSFGLGVYAPFGLGMQWPETAPFATAGYESKLSYITATPVVAWKPHATLSVAAGPTFNYSKAKFHQSLGAPGANLVVKGDDMAPGFCAGMLYQPYKEWSFGFTYRSRTDLEYDGTASTPLGTVSTTTHLKYPDVIVGGISFRPTTNWNFEVNIDWANWDRVDNVVIDGIGSLTLNWESSFFYEFGVTRYLGQGYFISAGYFYSEASTPEADFTPLVPDINLHTGSLGFGYDGPRWRWAIAGQLIGGSWRTVDDANNPVVNGRWRIFTPTVSLSVGYRF